MQNNKHYFLKNFIVVFMLFTLNYYRFIEINTTANQLDGSTLLL